MWKIRKVALHSAAVGASKKEIKSEKHQQFQHWMKFGGNMQSEVKCGAEIY